jgi:hypothetical protein
LAPEPLPGKLPKQGVGQHCGELRREPGRAPASREWILHPQGRTFGVWRSCCRCCHLGADSCADANGAVDGLHPRIRHRTIEGCGGGAIVTLPSEGALLL